MRKIIQIFYVNPNKDFLGSLHALCNDGTIWFKIDGDHWMKDEDIPQDEPCADNCGTANYGLK
jgi:hypothetical protein